MALGGIALAGLVSLAAILIDTWQTRGPGGGNDPTIDRLFGLFRAPVGLAVAGLGALLSAIAFPLDNYWHVLYGIDVTIWAPFHVMLITGMGMAGLGALAVLAAEAVSLPPGRARRLAQVGFAAGLAVTWATFFLIATQAAADEGLARIGGYEFVLYPVLLAFALPGALIPAVRVARLPGAATLAALAFLLIRQAMVLFVPPAMAFAQAIEGLTARANAPAFILIPFAFPTAIVAAAVVIDVVAWSIRRRKPVVAWPVAVAGAVTAVADALWDRPWALSLPARYFPELDLNVVLLNAMPFTVVAALAGTALALLLSRGLAAPQASKR